MKPVFKRRLIFIIVFALMAILLVVISMSKLWVERNYTYGIYPFISEFQRLITGIVPFSIGDVLYTIVFCWVIYKISRNLYFLFVRKLTLLIALRKLSKLILILLGCYIIFLLVWGLNYSRKGIRYQLGLGFPEYNQNDLVELQGFLIKRVNKSKRDLMKERSGYPENKELFRRAVSAYSFAEHSYPFLKYTAPAIKSSLYGSLGNYLGFTGYYNPFTGEAQVNTTVPKFLKPSITLHEIAHQIGYAKENEANFVGFLVGSNCKDPLFRYSAWLDLLMYTNRQLWLADSTAANMALKNLEEPVIHDIEEWKKFVNSHQSFLEPAMHWIYGKYLVFNDQPQGIRTYDAVVSIAIAYYKKNVAESFDE